MKRFYQGMLILGVLLCASTGCKKKEKEVDVATEVTVTVTPTTEPKEEVTTEPTMEPTEIVEPVEEIEQVINNGSQFVKIGDKVYFREYGENALEETTIGREFLSNVNPLAESRIVYWDESNQKLVEAFQDHGFGSIYYDKERFYLNEKLQKDNGEIIERVYSVDANGKDRKELGNGTIQSIVDGYLIVSSDNGANGENYQAAIDIYKDHQLVHTLTDQEIHYDYVGVHGGYLFYSGFDREIMNEYIYCVNMSDFEHSTRLGTIPKDMEYADYTMVEQVYGKGEDAYVAVGYYGGTGFMFYGGVIAHADTTREDSLATMTTIEMTDDMYVMPRFEINEHGEVVLVEREPGELTMEDNCLYLYGNDGQKEEIYKNLLPEQSGNNAVQTEVEVMNYVDGAAYLIVQTMRRNPGDDIGWREANSLIHTDYIRVTKEDGPQVVTSMNPNQNYAIAQVWLLDPQQSDDDRKILCQFWDLVTQEDTDKIARYNLPEDLDGASMRLVAMNNTAYELTLAEDVIVQHNIFDSDLGYTVLTTIPEGGFLDFMTKNGEERVTVESEYGCGYEVPEESIGYAYKFVNLHFDEQGNVDLMFECYE